MELREKLEALHAEIKEVEALKSRLNTMGFDESVTAIETAIDEMVLEARGIQSDIDFGIETYADFRRDLHRDKALGVGS